VEVFISFPRIVALRGGGSTALLHASVSHGNNPTVRAYMMNADAKERLDLHQAPTDH
jgi:hypothetical protein